MARCTTPATPTVRPDASVARGWTFHRHFEPLRQMKPTLRFGAESAIALLACVVSSPLFALEKKNLLFYAPMDGSLKAAIAKGQAEPLRENQKIQFVEGRQGQGVLTGGPDSEIAYPSAGNIDGVAGSVALWVKPLDWGKDDTWMRFFFRIAGGSSAGGAGVDAGDFAWLYKFFNVSVFWLVQRDMPQRRFFTVGPASGDAGGIARFDWEKGVWGHLIAAWSGNQMSLYVNGQYAGSVYVKDERILRRFAESFVLGGATRRTPPVNDTVLDDVMVLRVPVSPAEAQQICAKGIQAFDDGQSDAPLLQTTAGYLTSSETIRLMGEVIGKRPEALRGWSVSYEIRKVGGQDAVRKGRFQLQGKNRVEEAVEGAAFPVEKYATTCALLDDNETEVARATGEFEKLPRPEWLGNPLGMDPDVPPPWTPLALRENAVSCWGRTYAWDQAPLPVRIVSQGQELLARPVSLTARMEGEPVALKSSSPVIWNAVSASRAEFTSVAALRNLSVLIRGWLDFDGFLWNEIEIRGNGQRVESLVLEIPLRAETAALMHGFPWMCNLTGKTRDFETALSFAPVFWVGNERGGLQLYLHDYFDFSVERINRMFSMKMEEGAANLRVVLVDHPVPFDRPRRYAFGLIATPVKPMPKALREWEMELARKRSLPSNFVPVAEWQKDSTGFNGAYWEQWNRIGANHLGPRGYNVISDNTLKDLKAWFQPLGIKPWIYWAMNSVWCGDPVLKAFGAEWGGNFTEPASTHPYAAITPDRELPSGRDYSVWLIWKLIHENPELADAISGFYWDCAQAGWNDSNIFTALGTRELQRRLFRAIKKERPALRIMNHQSGSADMAQLAFADWYLTGEHLADALRLHGKPNYHEILNLDVMRAEYLGAKFGIPTVFLPNLTRAFGGDEKQVKAILGPEGVPAAEHLLGLLWCHDVIPYPAWINTGPFGRAARAKDVFGWDQETQFFGYWENGRLLRLKANRSPVVASLFLRKDRALFVVMNDTDEDAKVELSPDWRALNIPPCQTLKDAYAEQSADADAMTVKINNQTAKLVVPRRNFRVLVAR